MRFVWSDKIFLIKFNNFNWGMEYKRRNIYFEIRWNELLWVLLYCENVRLFGNLFKIENFGRSLVLVINFFVLVNEYKFENGILGYEFWLIYSFSKIVYRDLENNI